MTDLASKIAEGSNILADGQRFLLGQLRIGEEQLRLIGKLAWLKADEKVSQCYFGNDFNFHFMFKTLISRKDIEDLMKKYDIPGEYIIPQHSGPREAIIQPYKSEISSLRIYFHDIQPN